MCMKYNLKGQSASLIKYLLQYSYFLFYFGQLARMTREFRILYNL